MERWVGEQAARHLLMCVTILPINSGVIHIIAHVRQGAHGVEKQLLAVLTLDVNHPVP